MRIRTIKPAFWSSPDICDLPIPTRLHFIGLWNYADDEGRGRDNPHLIRAALWPLDSRMGVRVIERMQSELASRGLIRRYEVNGAPYFEVTGWEHQRIDKPQDSKIPPRPVGEGSWNAQGTVGEGSRLDRKGKEEGREGKGTGLATVSRPRDPIWDVLADCYGEPTEPSRGAWNRAAKVLRDANADPVELQAFVEICQHGQTAWAVVTPSALAKHWGSRRQLLAQSGSPDPAARYLALADSLGEANDSR